MEYSKFSSNKEIVMNLACFFNKKDLIFRRFIDKVNNSNFSLEDWVQSLVFIKSWLLSEELELSLEDSIEYIDCVSKSINNLAHLESLLNKTKEFLLQYGCEKAVKIDT